MLRRQKPGEFHNYPEHRSVTRRLLWRLGFDPLTVYERLAQVDIERCYWKDVAADAEYRAEVDRLRRQVAEARLNPRPPSFTEDAVS